MNENHVLFLRPLTQLSPILWSTPSK